MRSRKWTKPSPKKSDVCRKCGGNKIRKQYGEYSRAWCPICDYTAQYLDKRRKARQTAAMKDPEAWRRSRRNIHLTKTCGITLVEYEERLLLQGGVCSICKKCEPVEKHSLHVDHDHLTGKIRGLLCSFCNRGIGSFHDDPELLMKASLYLKGETNAAQRSSDDVESDLSRNC